MTKHNFQATNILFFWENAQIYICPLGKQRHSMILEKTAILATTWSLFLRENVHYFQIPSFNGKSSHLIFSGLGKKSPLWNDFELVIRPTSANGLILYNGDQNNPNGDFVAIFLSQGFIEFAFDAGDGATIVRYKDFRNKVWWKKHSWTGNIITSEKEISQGALQA